MTTVYLVNWDTTANWESIAEERLAEAFTSFDDFCSPQCTAVLNNENQIAECLQAIKVQLVEWFSDMEQPLKECRWHCRGWHPVSGPVTVKEAIYELIEVESLYDKAFKVPEPLGLAVIREVNTWSSK